MRKVSILGLGGYIPEKIVTNQDMEKVLDTSDEWITTRTGIKERRFAADNELTSDLAAAASIKALEDANLKPEDIELIILATNSPDKLFYPATACIVQDKIGARNAAAFDLLAGCTGWIYAATVGAQFVQTGMYKSVLVIGAEIITRMMDKEDRSTYVLFGDGAGAAVLGPSENGGFLAYELFADGSLSQHLEIEGGGTAMPFTREVLDKKLYYTKMNGREIFKFSVREIERMSNVVLEKAGLSVENVDWFIPHQANIRIIDAGVRRMGFPNEKVVVTIDKFGNSSAASVPVALDKIYREGKIKKGDKILMVSFGAGMTSGGVILEWSK
jgi:3-oxoacyl-[acyl-carrier-protein] synthase-3